MLFSVMSKQGTHPSIYPFIHPYTHYHQLLISNKNNPNSESSTPTAPMCSGFYRLEKGTPLVYEYTYDEMKIIVEGEFTISDESGQKVKATPGDVFFFPKGSKITFETESYGLGFYVGLKPFFFFLSFLVVLLANGVVSLF